jgi:hypothetical protein
VSFYVDNEKIECAESYATDDYNGGGDDGDSEGITNKKKVMFIEDD